MKKSALPKIVSQKKWESASRKMLAKEKKLTRAHDKLAAQRRQMPMVEIEKDYVFDGPKGKVSLIDLFEGRSQLILYHFMYHPEDDRFCIGCSFFTDQVAHTAHLHARDTSYAMVSRAPYKSIQRHQKRMEWKFPWYSSAKSTFNQDLGLINKKGEEHHGLSVFLRDGDKIYRTYFIGARGVESLGPAWTLLDLTPLGRQEKWEKTPKGRPQSDPYSWWRFHDEYSKA
ncbi:MAG: DUF899 domain-containing protein [Bdellovibrionales bacterium]|nr:DUF899 domain-containing protein [Bdellovibrionales bacterium]